MKAKLYINKENLKYNIEYIKNKIGSNKDIIAMVKANAYGAGDVVVARELQKIGIKNFGVANIEEAIRIRKSGIKGMILITSVCYGNEIKEALENEIALSVSNIDNLKHINNIAKELNLIANIHLKIDTGMTRLGFSYNDIKKSKNEMLELKNIKIDGIYTHLSCADTDDEYTRGQINSFKEVLDELKQYINFKYVHILNSDGTQNYSNIDLDYTHVRVGLMLYGYTNGTKPILKLTAPILNINYVDKYTKVGYGGTYIAKPNTKIAIVKIGYADGISRKLSNKINVEINGKSCPIVGNICMDMCMVDVTYVDNAKVNDEVTFFDYTNDLKELSEKSGKIVYEFISNLGNRIERVVE